MGEEKRSWMAIGEKWGAKPNDPSQIPPCLVFSSPTFLFVSVPNASLGLGLCGGL
jgi:hypothetical protein